MKSIILYSIIGTFLSFLSAEETTIVSSPVANQEALQKNCPIPIGVLDKNILDGFMPQIMEEVAKEFKHQEDGRTRRDTREYGFSFFKMLNGNFSYDAPPEFFQQLGNQICKALGREAPIEFTNIILSVYEEGFHLEPHVDVNIHNLYGTAPFYFDEQVFGIIIEPDATGHLYFAKWEGEGLVPPLDIAPIFSLNEQSGTIFCLEGDYRCTPYFHAVSPVSKRRISITFRTVERTP